MALHFTEPLETLGRGRLALAMANRARADRELESERARAWAAQQSREQREWSERQTEKTRQWEERKLQVADVARLLEAAGDYQTDPSKATPEQIAAAQAKIKSTYRGLVDTQANLTKEYLDALGKTPGQAELLDAIYNDAELAANTDVAGELAKIKQTQTKSVVEMVSKIKKKKVKEAITARLPILIQEYQARGQLLAQEKAQAAGSRLAANNLEIQMMLRQGWPWMVEGGAGPAAESPPGAFGNRARVPDVDVGSDIDAAASKALTDAGVTTVQPTVTQRIIKGVGKTVAPRGTQEDHILGPYPPVPSSPSAASGAALYHRVTDWARNASTPSPPSLADQVWRASPTPSGTVGPTGPGRIEPFIPSPNVPQQTWEGPGTIARDQAEAMAQGYRDVFPAVQRATEVPPPPETQPVMTESMSPMQILRMQNFYRDVFGTADVTYLDKVKDWYLDRTNLPRDVAEQQIATDMQAALDGNPEAIRKIRSVMSDAAIQLPFRPSDAGTANPNPNLRMPGRTGVVGGYPPRWMPMGGETVPLPAKGPFDFRY